MGLLKKLNPPPLLGILLLVDFIFLALHAIQGLYLPGCDLLSVQKDGGIPEIYQYLKEAIIVVLLLRNYSAEKKSYYIFWSLLFLYILLDDSLSIHETLGDYIGYKWSLPELFGMAPHDIGEILVSLTAGILLLTPIGYGFVQSSKQDRKWTLGLIALLFLLIFFGIFLDTLHAAVDWGGSLLGGLEDGGEMLVMSLILAYVHNSKSFRIWILKLLPFEQSRIIE